MKTFLISWFLLICLLSGCSFHARIESRPKTITTIPVDCMHDIKITSFKKPCVTISNSLAICDQVEIHYSCIEFKQVK
jgi:hypothetical protein